MYVVTYSLREDHSVSDNYYHEAAIFTEEVLSQAEELAGQMIDDYRSFIVKSAHEASRAKEEYILEFLVLGTLWQVYSGDALGLDKVPQQLLTGLVKLRQQGGHLKPGIDFLRGILSTLFLSPDLYDNLFTLDPSMVHLEKLINWLAATGEFDQEVKRIKNWREFLSDKTQQDSSDILATALTLASWFEMRSEEVLGRYTPYVDRFLNEIRPDRYWNENVIFCGRRRVEYHLNMVGAEIMNRTFRKDFINTQKKLVIVPVCMRLQPEAKCCAVKTSKGLRCTGCTSECSVRKLSELGYMNDFEVVIVPHGSSLSKVDKETSAVEEFGAIGVACVLNLIAGGWMLKEMGIPAQCVLLDYCGCKKHWHKEGIPTEINLNRLKQILEIQDGEKVEKRLG